MPPIRGRAAQLLGQSGAERQAASMVNISLHFYLELGQSLFKILQPAGECLVHLANITSWGFICLSKAMQWNELKLKNPKITSNRYKFE